MRIPLIFGVHTYGRYNEQGGHYRETRFFHLFFLPLIPLGGMRGQHGGYDEEAPISIISVLLGYFKVYGFLATLLPLLSVSIIISKGDGAGALWPVALGLWLGMVLVVTTWFWAGASPRSSTGKRVGSTLAVVLPFGALSALSVYSSASDQKTAEDRAAEEQRQVIAAQTQKEEALEKGLMAMLDQHAGAPVDKLTRCSDEMFNTISTAGVISGYAADAGYLRAAVTGAGSEEARGMEWIMSKRIRLEPGKTRYSPSERNDLADYPLFTLLSIEQPPAGAPRGPGRVTTKVTFHQLPSGRGICGFSFSMPLAAGKTLADAAVQAAYLAALKKEVGAVNARVNMYLPDAASK